MTSFVERLHASSELQEVSPAASASVHGTCAAARLMAATPAIAGAAVITSAVAVFVVEEVTDR